MSQRARYLSRNDGVTTFVMGDEAAALGALYTGCDFFAGYPITPASEQRPAAGPGCEVHRAENQFWSRDQTRRPAMPVDRSKS